MHKKHVTPEEAQLADARTRIVAELAHLRELIAAEVDLEPDEGDELITEHETAAILVGILEEKLQNVNAALASIRNGGYSFCERCGNQISQERLAAKPDARYCIACQGVVERIIHLHELNAATSKSVEQEQFW